MISSSENVAGGAILQPSVVSSAKAVSAGFYHSPGWGQDYPRIQILTIEELLHGAQVKMPPQYGTFKEAQRARLSGEAHSQHDF